MTAVAASFDERLEALFSSDPEAMAEAQTLYRELREAGPVHAHGQLVIVTRYPDVKAIFRDAERFSSSAKQIGTWAEQNRARLDEDDRLLFDDVIGFEAMKMVTNDGEPHDRLRRIAHRAFTPRRIAELDAAAQRYLDEMIEPLLEQESADLAEIAYRLPLMLIADLLGIPQSDRDQIHSWTDTVMRNRGGTEAEPLRAAHAAYGSFRAYVDSMLDEHRRAPDPTDLVSALMDAEQGEQLTADELTANFVMLLTAGHETTTNLIATGMLELLRARDQWEALAADPSLGPAATEELLRFVTPVQFSSRVPLVDVEVAGTTVPAGQTVRLLTAAANRDPDVFEDGDRLDVTRPNAREHLALGFGTHFCLGASLARLEGTLAFKTLARHFPELELATDDLTWGGNVALRKLKSLPVALGRPRRVAA